MGKVEKSKGQRMNCVRTLPVENYHEVRTGRT